MKRASPRAASVGKVGRTRVPRELLKSAVPVPLAEPMREPLPKHPALLALRVLKRPLAFPARVVSKDNLQSALQNARHHLLEPPRQRPSVRAKLRPSARSLRQRRLPAHRVQAPRNAKSGPPSARASRLRMLRLVRPRLLALNRQLLRLQGS